MEKTSVYTKSGSSMLKVYFTWHTTAKPRLGIRLVLTVSVTAKENKSIITQFKYSNRTFAKIF